MSLNEPLNAELEAQAQELAARIRARADDDILALARLLVSKNDAEVFGDTEFEARNIVHHVGAVALDERLKKAWLRRIGHRLPTVPAVREIPGGHRSKTPLSLMGPVPCARAYYYCGRCGSGLAPWDRVVGLTPRSLTPATERLVCLAGTFAFPHAWNWLKDALGRTCAYVSIDLTGVRQQAQNGGKAEGRMPYVAMIFNPVSGVAGGLAAPAAGQRQHASALSFRPVRPRSTKAGASQAGGPGRHGQG